MTRPKAYEVNFDGIVGPTHNYAGLSYGNIASQKHRHAVSNPKAAALQGLAKMKYLADLGVKQAVLPPPLRPHFPTLRRAGFEGSDADTAQSAVIAWHRRHDGSEWTLYGRYVDRWACLCDSQK